VVSALPTSGVYTSTQSVALSSLGSFYIRYSVDGSVPTCSVGTLFSSAISIDEDSSVKTIACDEASNSSEVTTFSYTISIEDVEIETVGEVDQTPVPSIFDRIVNYLFPEGDDSIVGDDEEVGREDGNSVDLENKDTDLKSSSGSGGVILGISIAGVSAISVICCIFLVRRRRREEGEIRT